MKVIKNKNGKVIAKKGDAFGKELNKVEERLKDVLEKIETKKINILSKILITLGYGVTEETFARISCLKNAEKLNYEQYYIDYETETQKFLLEFDIIFTIGEQPKIEVTAPIDVSDCL